MDFPLDAALADDWKEATLKQEEMSIDFAFEAMLRFLRIYIDLGEADTKDITRVVQYVESNRSVALPAG
ncbi:MAG: hypothetical protein IPK19_27135 [Chloroflexi bacterium]|nr:hypothetical protein [Chloroflexota bacterium]